MRWPTTIGATSEKKFKTCKKDILYIHFLEIREHSIISVANSSVCIIFIYQQQRWAPVCDKRNDIFTDFIFLLFYNCKYKCWLELVWDVGGYDEEDYSLSDGRLVGDVINKSRPRLIQRLSLSLYLLPSQIPCNRRGKKTQIYKRKRVLCLPHLSTICYS